MFCCKFAILFGILTLINLGWGKTNIIGHIDREILEANMVNEIASAIKEMVIVNFVQERKKQHFNCYTQVLKEQHAYVFGRIVNRLLNATGAHLTFEIGRNTPLPGGVGRHYSVLLIDSPKSLLLLYKIFDEQHLHTEGNFIILLHNFKPHYYDDLWDVFLLNYQMGVASANVLIYNSPKLILLYSSFPFTKYHCRGRAPIIANRYLKGRWQNLNFFPDQLTDLHGCEMICSTWEDLPYFKLNKNLQTGVVTYLGIEGKLLEYLSQRMNFTLKFNWLNSQQIEQTSLDNGSIFDQLFKNGTDFAIGAFPYKARHNDYFSPTTPYWLSNLYLVINTKHQSYDPFAKLLFPFRPNVWNGLLMAFLIACLLITLFRFKRTARDFVIGRRISTPVYNMFVVSLGGPVTVLPGRNFARFLLCSWLILTLVLRCAYQALLYHFLRAEISKPPPNTINEVLQQDFVLYMTDAVFKTLNYMAVIRNKAKILYGTEMENFEQMKYNSSKMAIICAKEYIQYYLSLNAAEEFDFHLVHEPVLLQHLSIYMARSSIFLSKFNTYISQYVAEGLQKKWENENYLPSSTHSVKDQQPNVMTFADIRGVFSLLIFGSVLSTVIFIGEWIYYLISNRFNVREISAC